MGFNRLSIYAKTPPASKIGISPSSPLDADGVLRFECPALNGTIGCPLRAGTVQAAREHGLPIVANPPKVGQEPNICTQGSVGVKVETDKQRETLKLFQKFYWGSPKQLTMFGKRTYVEGAFGTFKGDSASNKKRGSSLYMGLAHTALEMMCFGIDTNLRHNRSWHLETGLGDPNHVLLRPNTNKFGFVYLDEEQYNAFMESQASAA